MLATPMVYPKDTICAKFYSYIICVFPLVLDLCTIKRKSQIEFGLWFKLTNFQRCC